MIPLLSNDEIARAGKGSKIRVRFVANHISDAWRKDTGRMAYGRVGPYCGRRYRSPWIVKMCEHQSISLILIKATSFNQVKLSSLGRGGTFSGRTLLISSALSKRVSARSTGTSQTRQGLFRRQLLLEPAFAGLWLFWAIR